MMLATPVGQYFKGGTQLAKILLVDDLDRAAQFGVGNVKAAGNYASGLRGLYRAKKNDFDDVLYLDSVNHKYIDEATAANFIGISKDGTYVTLDSPSILESITNKSLEMFRNNKMTIH